MGLLDDVMASDAAALIDPDGFGEPVTYTPRGGSALSINAVVVRRLPDAVEESVSGFAPVMEIYIANDATKGVTAVDTGGDVVAVADRIGGTARSHPVAKVIDQDHGFWHLGLR